MLAFQRIFRICPLGRRNPFFLNDTRSSMKRFGGVGPEESALVEHFRERLIAQQAIDKGLDTAQDDFSGEKSSLKRRKS